MVALLLSIFQNVLGVSFLDEASGCCFLFFFKAVWNTVWEKVEAHGAKYLQGSLENESGTCWQSSAYWLSLVFPNNKCLVLIFCNFSDIKLEHRLETKICQRMVHSSIWISVFFNSLKNWEIQFPIEVFTKDLGYLTLANKASVWTLYTGGEPGKNKRSALKAFYWTQCYYFSFVLAIKWWSEKGTVR